MLCDDLEGWDGGWEGDGEEGDVCIHVPRSCCCAAETNTTLQSKYSPVKKKKNKFNKKELS